MAIIDRRDFQIYSDEAEVEDGFHCDDQIAMTIRILNLKGYKTVSCGAGTPFPSNVKVRFPEEGKIQTSFSMEYADLMYSAAEINVGLEAYITFEKGCEPQSVPWGWKLFVKVQPTMRLIYDGNYNDKVAFFMDKMDTLIELLEWAEELPEKK